MNRFNLTFSGEILPGQAAAEVKQRFGQYFAIDDPARLERFFCGDTITLRRNLERKTAAECFQDMRRLGIVAALVKVSASEAAEALLATTRSGDADEKNDTPQPQQQQKTTLPTPASTQRQRQQVERDKALREQARVEREHQQLKKTQARAAEKAEHEQAQRARDTEKAAQRERLKAEKAQEKALAKAKKQEARRQTNAAAKEQRELQRGVRQREREELARQKSERDAKRRKAAQEAARRRVLEEEQRRAQEAAALHERRAALAEKKAQAEAEAKAIALREAQDARQREALDEQAIERAAKELTSGSAVKPVKASVKTRLAVSTARRSGGSTRTGSSSRCSGEPNVYALQPFRNTAEVRERPTRARKTLRASIAVAIIALVALVGLFPLARSLAPASVAEGASALAASTDGSLILLAGDSLFLHDRAGIGRRESDLETLGLQTLQPPMIAGENGEVLATGLVKAGLDGSTTDSGAVSGPIRCTLEPAQCAPFGVDQRPLMPLAMARNDFDGAIFIAQTSDPATGSGELLKLDRSGTVSGRATLALSETPAMVPHAGLLFMTSPSGPAIRVLRYEDSAFAEQIDEVLLLPPGIDPGLARVLDFALLDNTWWVAMSPNTSHSAAVYRFDSQWNFLGEVLSVPTAQSLRLTAWAGKMLINTGRDPRIARFDAQGQLEAPLAANLLIDRSNQRRQEAALQAATWRAVFALLACVLLAAVAAGYLSYLRQLVYKRQPVQGAAPIEDQLPHIQWIEPLHGRPRVIRGLAISYCTLAVALCLLAIGQEASAAGLGSLLVALCGPAAALAIISRSPVGHIGVMPDMLLLVDHAGRYHFANGASIQYRGSWLLMDDVAVFTGNSVLPTFPKKRLATKVAPIARSGIKVDRQTVVTKLLQSRHPIAMAALLSAGACSAAIVLFLSLQLF